MFFSLIVSSRMCSFYALLIIFISIGRPLLVSVSSFLFGYSLYLPKVNLLTKLMCRYQYDLNSPGAASQLRVTSTKDLNLNFSVSNANMIIQAYASWSNLSHVHESYKKKVSAIWFFMNPIKYEMGTAIP